MKNWPDWQPSQKSRLPSGLGRWLTDIGSLTQRFQKCLGDDFNVSLLSNNWVSSCPDEAILLEQDFKQMIYQREVYLNNANNPVVYARTVIPLATYHALRFRFDTLGNRSLGEMLFTDPSLQRGRIEVARLMPRHVLYQKACEHLSDSEIPAMLWGRRSSFFIKGKRLLVNEVFLPSILWDEV